MGAAKTFRERTLLSLRHDIVHANHDRDYRRLSLFLSPVLRKVWKALRIFDILHSGSGDTVLQVNVIGSLEDGEQNGFVDLSGQYSKKIIFFSLLKVPSW